MSKKNTSDNATGGDEVQKKGFESTYHAERLREAIKSGSTAKGIMDKLDIKSKQVLKQHCLKLIQEDKVFYEITGLYEKGTRFIRATPKGEIKIGPSVLKAQGADVAPGDDFQLSVEEGRIILVKCGSGNTESFPDMGDNLEYPV